MTTQTKDKKIAGGVSSTTDQQTKSPQIVERMLKDVDPAVKRDLSLHAVRGIRSELSSRANYREYERAMRQMEKKGMLR